MRDTMILESVAQVRALAHPTRQRILRELTGEPRTNKQLAETLHESPARLHFHVRELEEAGLIELVEERPKGGVIEKYYRAVAWRYQLGPAVLGHGVLQEASLDAAREELGRAVAYFGEALPGARTLHAQARLSSGGLARLRVHLDAIDEELRQAAAAPGAEADGHNVMLTYLLHPAPPDRDE